ncbi:hypothetical protein Hanom_Chr01g00054571 [Helianthus anomalus]
MGNDLSFDHFIDISIGINSDQHSTSDAFAANDETHVTDNLSFVLDDLKHIDPTDLDERDILHQVALLSLRANTFYKRNGKTYPGLSGRSKVRLDKSKIKCFKCNRLGYFARESKSQTSNSTPIITYPSQRSQQNTQQQFYPQNAPGLNVQKTAHFAQNLNHVPVHYVPTPRVP